MQITIDRFIKEICRELNISIPTISFDTTNFTTETMIAQCDPENNIIYIKKFNQVNLDVLFAIAHELRHLWQINTSESFYTTHYSTSVSIEDYNKQIAEVDANAYAGLVMMDLFNVTPLFKGLSKDVVKMICDRMREIER